MGLSDWHAHEVIKEEAACVAANKDPLSSLGHYMSGGFGLKGSASLRFAFLLINSLTRTVAGLRRGERKVHRVAFCERSLTCNFKLIPQNGKRSRWPVPMWSDAGLWLHSILA